MADKLVDLESALQVLREEGIQRLLVEGGGTLNQELLRLNLMDRISVYIAPLIFGGETSPTFVNGTGLELEEAIHLRLDEVENPGDGGVVLHYSIIKG
jgi:riboflavin biosynthesis pyrimidine reductase